MSFKHNDKMEQISLDEGFYRLSNRNRRIVLSYIVCLTSGTAKAQSRERKVFPDRFERCLDTPFSLSRKLTQA